MIRKGREPRFWSEVFLVRTFLSGWQKALTFYKEKKGDLSEVKFPAVGLQHSAIFW